jgi:hypothetical protein
LGAGEAGEDVLEHDAVGEEDAVVGFAAVEEDGGLGTGGVGLAEIEQGGGVDAVLVDEAFEARRGRYGEDDVRNDRSAC